MILGISSKKFCIQIASEVAEVTTSLPDSRVLRKFQNWMGMQPGAQSFSRNKFLENRHQSFLNFSSFARFFTYANYLVRNWCSKRNLKVQSCKSYNNKYMIASTQITKTEIFAFIAVLDFKLLRRKVLFINRKDNRNC